MHLYYFFADLSKHFEYFLIKSFVMIAFLFLSVLASPAKESCGKKTILMKQNHCISPDIWPCGLFLHNLLLAMINRDVRVKV